MGRPDGKKEYILIEGNSLSDFNYKLNSMVRQGWKPVAIPITITEIKTEEGLFQSSLMYHQMMVKTYYINQEVK